MQQNIAFYSNGERTGKQAKEENTAYHHSDKPRVRQKIRRVFKRYGYNSSGWEVTGLDWKSGATRHRSILGKNNRANGAYAIIQYLANGDLLFNSVAGPIRVKY